MRRLVLRGLHWLVRCLDQEDHTLLARARILTRQQDRENPSDNGELKCHRVYARLIKEFPMIERRAIKRAIEAALLGLLFMTSVGCSRVLPVLYAQIFPANLGATWDPNPVGDNVVDYRLRLDGIVVATIPASVCSPTVCAGRFDVAAYGSHSLTVAARNARVDVLNDLQEGLQSDPVAFVLSAAPGKAGGQGVRP